MYCRHEHRATSNCISTQTGTLYWRACDNNEGQRQSQQVDYYIHTPRFAVQYCVCVRGVLRTLSLNISNAAVMLRETGRSISIQHTSAMKSSQPPWPSWADLNSPGSSSTLTVSPVLSSPSFMSLLSSPIVGGTVSSEPRGNMLYSVEWVGMGQL